MYVKEVNYLKTKLPRIVISGLCVLNIIFIFANSLMIGSVSASKSTGVRAFVNSIFSKLGMDIEITSHFIRKAAHFAEFMLLGILVTLAVIVFKMDILKNVTVPLFICLFTAVTDEFLQLFIEDRSGQVSDIVLDFSGALFGTFLVTVIYFILKIKTSRRKS